MAAVVDGHLAPPANGHGPHAHANGNGALPLSSARKRTPWTVRVANVVRAVNENVVEGIKGDVQEWWAGDGKDYLTGPDNGFLQCEDDFHNMDIAGLYIFETPLDGQKAFDQLEGYLASLSKVGNAKRMTSKIVRNKTTFGRPYFEPCADFDLRNHFAEVPLVVEGEQTPEAAELALGLLCGKLMAEGNDWDARPPWKMYHISGMILPGGKTGSAMFWKLHHALADGEGSVRPFISYLASIDPATGKPREGPVDMSRFQYQVTGKRNASGRATPVPGDASPAAVPSPAPTPSPSPEAKGKAGKKAAPASFPMSILEDRRVQAVIQTVAFVLFGLGVFLLNMLRLAFSGFRRSLWSKRGFFAEKQLGFSKRLPMREVKRVKNALGVSINDLMVTCTHSAVVKYARERDALKDSSLAYLVPTSLRARGDNAMNNQSSGWLLPLPVEGSEKSLLKVVRRRMNRFKKSLEPYLYFWGLNISGYFPWLVPLPSPGTALGRFVWPKFGKILSAITNVPGPSAQLFWAGVPYTQYVAVIPCATPNGLGLAIASYNEGISLGIQMDLDAGGVPGKDLYAKGDGFVIARLFEEAFEAMRKEADVAEARQAEAVKAEAK